MIRISSLVVCASLLACAMSQTVTTTVPQPTTTPTPTIPPTTQPPPPNDYIFRETPGSKPCLRMRANITAKFDYKNKTNGMPLSYSFTFVGAGAKVDQELSECPTKLVLRFDPPNDEGDFNFVTFTFMETSDKNAWTSEMVRYNFIVTEEEFPDSEYIGMQLTYNSTNKLLDSNVDLDSSYKCKANEDIKFDSSATEHNLNVVLQVVELQVRAYFKEPKDEEFGAVHECSADSGKGNKIVPIAVGAALAGLVIVVLIAYLIGRLKSRRQSSYEALS